jgi:hypothetical protein
MLYVALGRKQEAQSSVQDFLRIDPKFSAQRHAKSMSYKDYFFAPLIHKTRIPDKGLTDINPTPVKVAKHVQQDFTEPYRTEGMGR